MTDQDLLSKLQKWIDTVPEDVITIRKAIDAPGASKAAKKLLLGGLSYLLRKIDLIPDYMGGLGMLDDAAVLRVAAMLALEAGFENPPQQLVALGNEKELLEELLGDQYERFVSYVRKLPDTKIRNRTAETLLEDPESMSQFDHELDDEVRTYKPKPIGSNARVLDEFRSFIKAKL